MEQEIKFTEVKKSISDLRAILVGDDGEKGIRNRIRTVEDTLIEHKKYFAYNVIKIVLIVLTLVLPVVVPEVGEPIINLLAGIIIP